MQKSDNNRTSNFLYKIDNGNDNYDFKCMMTAGKVATSCIRGRLRDVQRVCGAGSKTLYTTIVEVV